MSTEIPLSESQTEQGEADTFKVLSSEDYGDIPLYDFLQWHISRCGYCYQRQGWAPPQFGTADTRKCSEYYEIVQEYSDYERYYISRADP